MLKKAKQNKQLCPTTAAETTITKEDLANKTNSVGNPNAIVNNLDEKNFHLSMHFATGQFKCNLYSHFFIFI